MSRNDQIEALTEVVIGHQRIPTYDGHYANRCCGCDYLHGESDGPNSPRHVAHQVDVLLDSEAFRVLVAGERAAALREAADRMPAFHDRDEHEWAITSACKWLRERAQRETP